MTRGIWPAGILAAAILAASCRPALEATKGTAAVAAHVTGLQCEYAANPLGIDAAQPRLGWVLEGGRRGEMQTAYQVLVAGSEARLKANRGDLWDSGKVASDRSVQVPYAGKPLRSGMRAYWKVRAWNRQDKPTPYSAPAWWEMGLLAPEEWHGKWIGRTADTAAQPAPLLRREFAVAGKLRRARVYVCGLGYYELRLNGKRVGDHILDPGYTRFDRRDLYATYDVTPLLKAGPNAVGAILGNGWYNVHTKAVWYFDRAPWRAAPKLLLELRLEYEDGRTETIATDTTWKTSTGPILWDSIYGGETYDARQEKPGWDAAGYDDSTWQPALAVAPPGGVLSAQQAPPIRVTDTLKPAAVTEPKPGVFLFDMGQEFAGHARLSVQGPAGTKITLRYGERLRGDGTLDQANIAQHMVHTDPPQRFQTDEYLLKGGGVETWETHFAYHGFRYVEATGFPGKPAADALQGRVVNTDFPPAGRFECSNPLLNRIQEATLWSYRSNFVAIPTDCPHREKNGWTGDAHLAAEQGLFNYAPAAAYEKWIDDLDDEMRDSGELPGIVPTSGWGYQWGNGPAWDSAFLLIPWYLHVYTGDTGVLERHYPKMRRYVDYLTGKAHDGGIVSLGLGDWVAPGPTAPVELTSTAYYYQDALIVSKAAALLGKAEDARKYADLAESIRRALNAKFLNRETGRYADGGQTAQSCALYQGLVEPQDRERVLAGLVAAVDAHQEHIFTGILGAKYVLLALLENGRADLAYQIVAQKSAPGWGNWIERGATTLWEDWGGAASLDHVMFGDVSAWFYKALAGIVPDPEAPGFRHFFVRPQVVGDLTSAQATYDSVRGRIASAWKVGDGAFALDVTVPANATATVVLPAGAGGPITESGKPADKVEGVKAEGNAFAVGSGTYHFRAAWR